MTPRDGLSSARGLVRHAAARREAHLRRVDGRVATRDRQEQELSTEGSSCQPSTSQIPTRSGGADGPQRADDLPDIFLLGDNVRASVELGCRQVASTPVVAWSRPGVVLANSSVMAVPSPSNARRTDRVEILIGRSLAYCAHPVAAWHRCSAAKRLLLMTGYFVASYIGVFGALELIR
jgi:hypothetical protein